MAFRRRNGLCFTVSSINLLSDVIQAATNSLMGLFFNSVAVQQQSTDGWMCRNMDLCRNVHSKEWTVCREVDGEKNDDIRSQETSKSVIPAQTNTRASSEMPAGFEPGLVP
jgi:hypothetical protein